MVNSRLSFGHVIILCQVVPELRLHSARRFDRFLSKVVIIEASLDRLLLIELQNALFLFLGLAFLHLVGGGHESHLLVHLLTYFLKFEISLFLVVFQLTGGVFELFQPFLLAGHHLGLLVDSGLESIRLRELLFQLVL